jgi:hypothetical protein
MSDKEDVIEGPGFTIIDRRIGAKKTEGDSAPKADKKASPGHDRASLKQEAQKKGTREKEKTEEKSSHEIPLPDVDFTAFVMSLCTSVFIHLGEICDPTTNQKCIDLPLAKQTIDIIAMLKEKTEGNRTKEEDQLIQEMLYNLRMQYLALSKKNP